ncbi:MAG TPA: serine/threonine-protein kinase, partial [Gammaproteobacteria bacterium]|nr:serine/threonine-protein kinase [Gammaproteobacteria bacterium]
MDDVTSQVKTDVGLTTPRALSSGHKLHWYELGEVLGQGAYGITYAARDVNLDQAVAIKEYFPDGFAKRDGADVVQPAGSDAEDAYTWGLTRFLDEAQTLAKFRHPAIVRVSSVFEANGTAYMVMDFERGKTLAELIKAGAIIGESRLLAIVLPLINGLEHVHESGIIHRDIKPANIIMRSDGSPVLLDFGAARQAGDAGDRQLTNIGTPGYAPFEQFDGSGEAKQGPWTDIYSLGVMLYEIVGGQRPTDALRRGAALMDGGKDPLRPLNHQELSQCYSAELLGAIEHALAFRVPDRPRSIKDWRALYPVLSTRSRQTTRSFETGSATAVKDSAPGKKTFSNMDEAVNAALVTESTRSTVQSLHVMVVDDEPFVLNLLKRIL